MQPQKTQNKVIRYLEMTGVTPVNPFNPGGFTLIEVMLVIALIAVTYVVALPNFSLRKDSAINDQIGMFISDIKNAFDEAVLSGKPHRLVYHLASGEYWLERTESRDFVIGGGDPSKDPSPDEEKAKKEEIKESFKKYEDLLGEGITLSTLDSEPVKPESPVTKALKRMLGADWTRVDTREWRGKSLGDFLVIRKMQSEHLNTPVSIDDAGNDAWGILYFMPGGYVERAYFHIYYRGLEEGSFDEKQKPYTIYTKPYQGIAEMEAGAKEIDPTQNQDPENDE